MSEGRWKELDIELITGRTHQIRAQLKAEGVVIVGDWLYGSPFVPIGDTFALCCQYVKKTPLDCYFCSYNGKSLQFSGVAVPDHQFPPDIQVTRSRTSGRGPYYNLIMNRLYRDRRYKRKHYTQTLTLLLLGRLQLRHLFDGWACIAHNVGYKGGVRVKWAEVR
jgi:hypothetical protein